MPNLLKVGLITQPPFIEKCVGKLNQPCYKTGTSMEMFTFITSLLGYTKLEMVVAKEQRQYVNETIGGLLGMLVRGEVDASPTLFSVSPDPAELSLVDYSLPVATSITGFLIGEPQYKQQRYTNIFQPFSIKLWIWMGFCTLLTRVLLRLHSFASKKIGRQLESQRIFAVTKAFGLMFIVLKAYKTQLIGALVSQQKAPLPFNSLETYANMFEAGDLQMASRSSAPFLDIERLDIKPYVKIRNAWRYNPIKVFPSENLLYNALASDPKLTYRLSEASYIFKTADVCNITFVPVTFSWLAYVFPKGSKLVKDFNSILYSKGHSVEDYNLRLLSRYTKPKRCQPPKTVKSYRQLALKDEMSGSFVFLLAGFGIAFVLLLAELLIKSVVSVRNVHCSFAQPLLRLHL